MIQVPALRRRRVRGSSVAALAVVAELGEHRRGAEHGIWVDQQRAGTRDRRDARATHRGSQWSARRPGRRAAPAPLTGASTIWRWVWVSSSLARPSEAARSWLSTRERTAGRCCCDGPRNDARRCSAMPRASVGWRFRNASEVGLPTYQNTLRRRTEMGQLLAKLAREPDAGANEVLAGTGQRLQRLCPVARSRPATSPRSTILAHQRADPARHCRSGEPPRVRMADCAGVTRVPLTGNYDHELT